MTQSLSSLEKVGAAKQELNTAKDKLLSAVLFARANGSSWQEIANQLGISKQAAWEMYSAICDPDGLVNSAPPD